ncbi:MAG TPA: sigma 54-interacting transcriptional regulator, partial [bacterium]|nr:sigma 54-interacting transcriptional regulator [bacterium]
QDVGNDSPTQIKYVDGKASSLSLVKSRLVVVDGPDRGKEMVVGKDSIKIGTFKGCDFVLTDKTVSRSHCEIRTMDDGFILRDEGSTNGTVMDGYRVREIYLKPGTIFHVGKTAIRFQPLSERVEIPLSNQTRFGSVIGVSVKMREVFGILEKIAPTDLTVLIEGETGTGKEVVARSIHTNSTRKNKAFIVVDCGAIPRNLIESELFGHEKGSFTGATEQRKGAFELANGGTIFLDELGELPLDLQPKLLRALENREIRRIGSATPVQLDVRVIAATNRNLMEMVTNNTFREDLFFRLAVAKVRIPPLRERKEDIPALVEGFLAQMTADAAEDKEGTPIAFGVTEKAMQALTANNWAGNVRELRNVIERAIFLSSTGTVDLEDIMLDPRQAAGAPPSASYDLESPFKDAKNKIIETFERAYLRNLLTRNKGNISRSAREADIERKYLKDLMKKHGLRTPSSDDDERESEGGS